MSPSPNSDSSPINPRRTLADRVQARVAEAERLLTPPRKNSLLAQGDTRSLRKVYREMRTVYRNYRRQTGSPAVAELRTAVQAFKKGQSLTSLVEIASFLDDRKLLAW
jgi:hypothetical protein